MINSMLFVVMSIPRLDSRKLVFKVYKAQTNLASSVFISISLFSAS